MLIDVPDTEESVPVKVPALNSAVLQIQSIMRSNKELLPCTYQFARELHPSPLNCGVYSTGGNSGIRVVGDDVHYYSLHAGFDECVLTKMAVKRGRGVVVETKDIRGTTELMTSNMGKISIRKSRARTDVTKLLKDLVAFLETVDQKTIQKTFG